MKRGSRESSSSVRRSVRTAWLSALSDTITSLHTRSKISRRVTASCRCSTRKTRRSKYRGIRGRSRPPRTSVRRRGESVNSANRYRGKASRVPRLRALDRIDRLPAEHGSVHLDVHDLVGIDVVRILLEHDEVSELAC